MYHILIAEDEPVERESLMQLLYARFPGKVTCSTAENGQEVLQNITGSPADIIIMDINMPGVNGLEALRNLRENGFQNQIIIFSAYDCTDYLKSAINYGADAFVLKPEQNGELEAAIQNSMRAIDKLRQSRSIEQQLCDQLALIANQILHPILGMAIWEDARRAQTLEKLRERELPLSSSVFLAIEFPCGSTHAEPSISEMSHAAALLRMHPFLFEQSYVSLPRHNLILILCMDPALKTASSYAHQINQAAQYYRHLLFEKTGMQVWIGAGLAQSSLERCAESYLQSIRALCHTSEKQPIRFFSQLHSSMPEFHFAEVDFSSPDTLPDALECLHSDFLRELRYMPAENWPEAVFCYWIELCRHIQRAVPSADFSGYLKLEINKLRVLSDREAVHEWLEQHCGLLLEELIHHLPRRRTVLIQRAIDYINLHFSEPLSLDLVAERIGISPHYLSHIFPSEVGCKFIDYLTNVRMKNLYRLLAENPSCSTGELANQLGYSDSAYFCKVVKRLTGKTIRELKNDLTHGRT